MSSLALSMLFLRFLGLLLLSVLPFSISSPFSTVAFFRISNETLVCAIVPSAAGNRRHDLSCTSTSSWRRRLYRSYGADYAAVVAGDGFLCGLASAAGESNATMLWWDFHGSEVYEETVYSGPALTALAGGDAHVCGLIGGVQRLKCWQWEEVVIPAGVNFLEIAVGRDFACGRLDGGEIRCFGKGKGVVGKEPIGNFSIVAAGSTHVCGVYFNGSLICWGEGAPEIDHVLVDVISMALGENRTCVLRSDGRVLCWGQGAQPPDHLAFEHFIAIQARGDAICGILLVNYSLVCWGNELFLRNHTVYGRVLPGTCSLIESCSCSVLPGSSTMCASEDAGICRSCNLKLRPNTSDHSSPSSSQPANSKRVLLLILGSVGFGMGLIAILSFFQISVWSKNQRTGRIHGPGATAPVPTAQAEPTPVARRIGGTIEEFSIGFLLNVTDNFSEVHKIGSGSFGAVYRATLPNGYEVAIKRADVPTAAAPSMSRRHEQLRLRDKEQRERAFSSELDLLSRINHRNLVRLLGFCQERGERVLVYEYMANGTLHDQLHRRLMAESSPLSTWPARLQLALHAARGIEYLHAYAVPGIIHRDIKSANILLDADWTAKVADFGLSLTSPDEEGSIAAGTVGYMDPEYYRLRRLTEKSDVYSFGVVLLELVTGCKAIHRSQGAEEGEGSATPRNVVEMAVPWIKANDVGRVMDRRVAAASADEAAAVAYIAYVAAECVRAEGRNRPTMGEVVGALERAVAACRGGAGGVLRMSRASSSVT